MSNFRQGKMKAQNRKKTQSAAPTEQDVRKEAKSLQELLRLSAIVVSCLLLLLLLFWIFA